jgi:predicted  nucleic acid-binding Zn-ribbon protein
MSLNENLLKLFRIDSQVRGLRGRLESAQRYLDGQQARLDELNRQRNELESRHRQLQATVGNLETECKGLTERIEMFRDELNSATTNKIYSARLTELNTAKLSFGELETREIEEMEKIDVVTAELEKIAAETVEREKVRVVAVNQLKERRDEIGSRLAELESEREVAAEAVPGAELRVFNEMADCYDGEAMANIGEIDRRRREYACGECNIHLPFEAVALLMGHTETLSRCPACQRILYLEDETRGALAKK